MTSFRETPLGRQVQGIREARRKLMLEFKPAPPTTRRQVGWSTSEIKKAMALRAEGKIWSVIAKELGTGRTWKSVAAQVKRQLARKR